MSDAAITIIGRVLLIPIIIGYLALAFHRIKSSWSTSNRRVIVLMISCSVLLLISVVSAIPKPVTMIADIIRMTTMLYAMFFAYITLKHLWEEKSYIPILKDPFFAVTNAVCILVVIADMNRNSYGVITDNDPVEMGFFYTTSALASFILMSVFSAKTFYLLYKTGYTSKSLVYRARLSISGVAFLVITICCVSTIINIILAYFGDFGLRSALNMIYHYGKLIYFPCMFAVIMLPERTFNYLLTPIRKMQEQKKEQDQREIRLLHEKITAIVPSVKLNYGLADIDDMVVEIADARMILWTNVRGDGEISPQTEATIIRDLLGKNTVFSKPGVYLPAQPPNEELSYNLNVAKHLKNLI